jgi:hypothetical protein
MMRIVDEHDQPLDRRISRFYDRWHRFERTLGRDDGQILDFDMAPRADRSPMDAPEAPFDSRLATLRALAALRDTAESAGDVDLRPLLSAKLRGADAYLRALMGERIPFDVYLEATMGIAPAPATPEWIATERASLEEAFEARGVPYAPEGREQYRAVFGRADLSGFEQELRASAHAWLERVGAALPRPVTPEYSLEVVREDAYWTNWIDGSVETGVRLRVNTHPRTEYVAGSSLTLAAHEIAGHALHVAMLRASADAGRFPRWGLNLAVHSCEAFHMEGLAQSVMHLAGHGVVPDDVLLLERHSGFRNEVVNAAQVELEAGRPVAELLETVAELCPLVNPVGVASDLRDRSRQPVFRGYVHVYAPARRLFLRAAALPGDARWKFFAHAYETVMTPTELSSWLQECAGSAAPGVTPGAAATAR